MPLLRNPKHEVFAAEYAKTGNATKSAMAAGFSERSAHVYGSRLIRQADIKERVDELKNRVAEHVVADLALNKEWVLTKLTKLYYIAEDKKQVSAGTRCLELIGKEIGMFQDVVSKEVFTTMLSLMGAVVAANVSDPAALERIMAGWSKIEAAEPRQLKSAAAAGPASAGLDIMADLPEPHLSDQ